MPIFPGDTLFAELIIIRPDIPVLLCTGFSKTISNEKALLSGFKGFLIKPVTMNQFAVKIREILDNV